MSSLKFRSIYSASIDSAESQCGFPPKVESWKAVSVPEAEVVSADVDGNGTQDSFDDEKDPKSKKDAVKEHRGDPIQLPDSTHTLFFTSNILSLPGFFALGVAALSVGCLALALINALEGGSSRNPVNVPENVTSATRGAQYLSIFVALLMEEEIPTGLAQLRLITYGALCQVCPKACYKRFCLVNMFRILMGYLFLTNVLLVLIQAEDVLTIFYDVLALQFVQQLDDIAFRLARMDVFGRRLQRACTAYWFDAEFEYRKGCWKHKIFLKSVYFMNMLLFISAMVVISARQMRGYYQCKEITGDFGDGIFEEAYVRVGTNWEQWILVYSYFNGVFIQDGTFAGRPLYKEARKSDRMPYLDNQNGSAFPVVIPAEIKYCEEISAWVLTHENIRKSENDESSCNWLLRSPETDSFDVLDAAGKWDMWVGVVSTTEVLIACNNCDDNSDCNLNGVCSDDGRCICDEKEGVTFFGSHCEVKLRDECRTIIPEVGNYSMSIEKLGSWSNEDVIDDKNSIWTEYSRPVFSGMIPSEDNNEQWTLVYSGSRWFGMNMTGTDRSSSGWRVATRNFHAFWYRAYNTYTVYVSDPTKESSPVGVDWYMIGERGHQYGPLGALYPVQRYNQTGRGVFRCAGISNEAVPSSSARNLSLSHFDRKLTSILKGHVHP